MWLHVLLQCECMSEECVCAPCDWLVTCSGCSPGWTGSNPDWKTFTRALSWNVRLTHTYTHTHREDVVINWDYRIMGVQLVMTAVITSDIQRKRKETLKKKQTVTWALQLLIRHIFLKQLPSPVCSVSVVAPLNTHLWKFSMWLDPFLQNWVKQNHSDTTGSLRSFCLRLQVVGQEEED